MRLSITTMLMLTSACGSAADCPPPRVVEATPAPAPRLSSAAPEQEVRMDLERMDQIVRSMSDQVRREQNVWQLQYEGVLLTIVTDVRANRMRIVAAVGPVANLTPDQHQAVMLANFHTALDARYAVSQGTLFSAFIHPLSTLHPDDLKSGIRQTATLAQTFGTSYNSGELIFGGGAP